MQQFSNVALHVTIADQVLCECLSNEDVTIHNLLITNSSDQDLSINLFVEKNLEQYRLIPLDLIIRAKNTLEMKPINLTSGDKLFINSSVDGEVDAFGSILKEIRDF